MFGHRCRQTGDACMLHPYKHFKAEAEETCFEQQHRQPEQNYESATGVCRTPPQRGTLVKKVQSAKSFTANTEHI